MFVWEMTVAAEDQHHILNFRNVGSKAIYISHQYLMSDVSQ